MITSVFLTDPEPDVHLRRDACAFALRTPKSVDGLVTDAEIGRCAVSRGHAHWVVHTGQHPLLGLVQGGFSVWHIVAVTTYQPYQAPPTTRIQALVVRILIHERHRVGELITRLTLGPIDGLQDIAADDVVGSGPTVGRVRFTAMQVHPEARCVQLPRTVPLVNGENAHAHESSMGTSTAAHIAYPHRPAADRRGASLQAT